MCEAQKAKKMGKALNQATKASSNAHRDIFTALFELLLNKMLSSLQLGKVLIFQAMNMTSGEQLEITYMSDYNIVPSQIYSLLLALPYTRKMVQNIQ
jgi:hypothetical protein